MDQDGAFEDRGDGETVGVDRRIIEAEFRGLFAGEGFVSFYINKNAGPQFRCAVKAHLAINLRSDSAATLDWVVKHFGGNLYGPYVCKDRGWNPMLRWYVATRRGILRIVGILLGGTLPYRKRMELEFLREGLSLLPGIRGKRIPEENIPRLRIIESAIKVSKKWDVIQSMERF